MRCGLWDVASHILVYIYRYFEELWSKNLECREEYYLLYYPENGSMSIFWNISK